MPDRPIPAHQSRLYSALIGPAHGADLDARDLDRLAIPNGHSRDGWRATVRKTAAQAREAFDDGRHGDARRIILEFAQSYSDAAQEPITSADVEDLDTLSPQDLADRIPR